MENHSCLHFLTLFAVVLILPLSTSTARAASSNPSGMSPLEALLGSDVTDDPSINFPKNDALQLQFTKAQLNQFLGCLCDKTSFQCKLEYKKLTNKPTKHIVKKVYQSIPKPAPATTPQRRTFQCSWFPRSFSRQISCGVIPETSNQNFMIASNGCDFNCISLKWKVKDNDATARYVGFGNGPSKTEEFCVVPDEAINDKKDAPGVSSTDSDSKVDTFQGNGNGSKNDSPTGSDSKNDTSTISGSKDGKPTSTDSKDGMFADSGRKNDTSTRIGSKNDSSTDNGSKNGTSTISGSKDDSSTGSGSKDDSSTGSDSKDDSSTGSGSKDDSSTGSGSKDVTFADSGRKNDISSGNGSKDDSSTGSVSKDVTFADSGRKNDTSSGNGSKDDSSTGSGSKDDSSTGSVSKDDSSTGSGSKDVTFVDSDRKNYTSTGNGSKDDSSTGNGDKDGSSMGSGSKVDTPTGSDSKDDIPTGSVHKDDSSTTSGIKDDGFTDIGGKDKNNKQKSAFANIQNKVVRPKKTGGEEVGTKGAKESQREAPASNQFFIVGTEMLILIIVCGISVLANIVCGILLMCTHRRNYKSKGDGSKPSSREEAKGVENVMYIGHEDETSLCNPPHKTDRDSASRAEIPSPTVSTPIMGFVNNGFINTNNKSPRETRGKSRSPLVNSTKALSLRNLPSKRKSAQSKSTPSPEVAVALYGNVGDLDKESGEQNTFAPRFNGGPLYAMAMENIYDAPVNRHEEAMTLHASRPRLNTPPRGNNQPLSDVSWKTANQIASNGRVTNEYVVEDADDDIPTYDDEEPRKKHRELLAEIKFVTTVRSSDATALDADVDGLYCAPISHEVDEIYSEI